MILTHKIINILKTAPCRACSTSPNLYSLTTVIVLPQWLVFIMTELPRLYSTDSVWQTIRSHESLVACVLSNVVINLRATSSSFFWSLIPGTGNQTSWRFKNRLHRVRSTDLSVDKLHQSCHLCQFGLSMAFTRTSAMCNLNMNPNEALTPTTKAVLWETVGGGG